MSMKKLVNDPFNVVDELIDGFVLANDEIASAPRVAVSPHTMSGRAPSTCEV